MHFRKKLDFTLRNGCEKVSQKEIDAIKEDKVRVKYCGLNDESCLTNYPQHVFMPTNSQVVNEDVILGEPWITRDNHSLQMADTDHTTGNLRKRFIQSVLLSFYLLFIGNESILRRRTANKMKNLVRKVIKI